MYSIEKFVCRLQKENRVLHTRRTRRNAEEDAEIVYDLFFDIMFSKDFWNSWVLHVQRLVGAHVSDAIALQAFMCGVVVTESKQKIFMGNTTILYQTKYGGPEYIVIGSFWYYVYSLLQAYVGAKSFTDIAYMCETDEYYQTEVFAVFVEKLNKHVHSRKRVDLDFVRVMRYMLPQIQYVSVCNDSR